MKKRRGSTSPEKSRCGISQDGVQIKRTPFTACFHFGLDEKWHAQISRLIELNKNK